MKFLSSTGLWAALSPWAAIALGVFAAALFTFLQTDDYCTVGHLIVFEGGNPFANLAEMYMTWTGRYSSSFLVALTATASLVVTPTVTYPAFLLLFSILFLFACLQASRILHVDGAASLPLALVAFCGTMAVMPSKLEQYLWVTGAAVYFVGASLLLILMARMVADNRPSWRQEIVTWLLIAMVTGFNEFLAILLGGMLAWTAIDQWLLRHLNGARLHLPRLLIFGIAFAVTVLAPGNFARDATATVVRHDLNGATAMMFKSMGLFFQVLLDRSLPTLLVTLSAAVCAAAMKWRSTTKTRSAREWLPYVVLLLLAFPMHYWVYSFLTGQETPGRIANQAVTLALVALCAVCARAGYSMVRRIPWSRATIAAALIFALAGIGLGLTKDYRLFATTLVEFAPKWREQQVARHEGLVAHRGSELPVYVQPFDPENSNPPIFNGADISGDPTYWVNRCVGAYYGINKVILMRRIQSPAPRR